MDKRFALLLAGCLVFGALGNAQASLFTLSGVKKASQIQFYHGPGSDDLFEIDRADNDGVAATSEWTITDYDNGVVLRDNTNWKSKTVEVEAEFDSPLSAVKFAIFKANGKLKAWGEVDAYGLVSWKAKRLWKTEGWGSEKWTAPVMTFFNPPPATVDPVALYAVETGFGGSEGEGAERFYEALEDGLPGVSDAPGGPAANNGPAPIPEPGTILLLGGGLMGLARAAKNKFRK